MTSTPSHKPPAIVAGLQEILDATKMELLGGHVVHESCVLVPLKGGRGNPKIQSDIAELLFNAEKLRVGGSVLNVNVTVGTGAFYVTGTSYIKNRPDMLVIDPERHAKEPSDSLVQTSLLEWVSKMQDFIDNPKNWPQLEKLTAQSRCMQEAMNRPVNRNKIHTPPTSSMLDHILSDALETYEFDKRFSKEDRQAVSIPYGSSNAASTVANALRQSLELTKAYYADSQTPASAEILDSIRIEVPTKHSSNQERNAHIRISSPNLEDALGVWKSALADRDLTVTTNKDHRLSSKEASLGRILTDQMMYQIISGPER